MSTSAPEGEQCNLRMTAASRCQSPARRFVLKACNDDRASLIVIGPLIAGANGLAACCVAILPIRRVARPAPKAQGV